MKPDSGGFSNSSRRPLGYGNGRSDGQEAERMRSTQTATPPSHNCWSPAQPEVVVTVNTLQAEAANRCNCQTVITVRQLHWCAASFSHLYSVQGSLGE